MPGYKPSILDNSVAPADLDSMVYSSSSGMWTPRSFARAQMTLTTAQQWTSTGGGTYDTLIQTGNTFTAAALNYFTHSNGILTYTGAGETALVFIGFAAIGYGAPNRMTFGPSVNNGDPAAGNVATADTQATYARSMSLMCYVTLATGDTLRIKAADDGVGGTVAPRIGTRLVVL